MNKLLVNNCEVQNSMIQHVIDYLGFGVDIEHDFNTILFIDKDRQISWGEFQQEVAAAALSLVEKGYRG